jgi:membrane protease YdiL (CAAX protease family)
LFAAVHFLKPDPSVKVEVVHWTSGLALVPSMFHQFVEPLLLLGGFGTLLVFGLVLGMAAQRTGSLWLSIGLHAGLVFVKLVFAKGAELRAGSLPWVGAQLEVGVWPILTLLLLGACVWAGTRGSSNGASHADSKRAQGAQGGNGGREEGTPSKRGGSG